jgi:protein-S-isoprenylcysteine O-methyltransferase Ste14
VLPLVFAWLGAAAFAGSLGYFLFTYFVTFGAATEVGPTQGFLIPAAVDAVLFSVFALHHSLFARTRVKTIVAGTVPPALERAVYSWIASALFVIVCAAWRTVPGVIYSIPSPWSWAGYAAQAAGVLFTFFGARSLDVLDLAGVRQVVESRRPDPAGPAHAPLQTGGVYGVVRHPLYFGWALLVFGAPHMTADRFTFALVSTIYLALAIPFEERGLDDVFGSDYSRYRKHVRWRMLPGLY